MSYSEDFQQLIEEGELAHFLRLWEEYCLADQVEAEELKKILSLIKESNFAETFGQFAETTLPLWKKIEDQRLADDVLCLILDLQTTNSPVLAELACEYLQKHYEQDKYFKEKIRIIGLRARRSFQGAISNFELLNHMNKGSFVFHTGGWGVGEVMDISLLREHALFEFEGITALKELSFDNAFKHLIPLPSDHFLACRFGNPDALEKLAKEDPVEVMRLLLRDLGPKTAQAIKDELSELVIPAKDWSKWWQTARAKLKKDTKIKSPKWAKDPFLLREKEVPHEIRFKDLLKETTEIEAEILLIYNFTRDFPEILKNEELKQQIKSRLLAGLEKEEEHLPTLTLARHIQIFFLLEDIFPKEFSAASVPWIKKAENLNEVLNLIEIIAFKKRTLTVVRECFDDWTSIFLHLLFIIGQNPIRDYLFKELQNDETAKELLADKAHELLNKMTLYPEAFFWYFQKISAKKQVPLNDSENRRHFLEAFLILLHYIEDKIEYRDLAKKMYQHLTAKRYQIVRSVIEGASIPYLKEFLLLASKCQSFTKHDLKILHNLAEVVHPSLSTKKGKKKEEDVIWTTQEAFRKMQERIQHIGTVETVENAREIEAARALGDLRENAEYKFALEKRSRLQAELKRLSHDLNRARILTKEDISTDRVGVGATIQLLDSKGHKISYTLLGPWDADPEHHILSFQSKLAQAMIGCKQGETFNFQGESYTVQKIKSAL